MICKICNVDIPSNNPYPFCRCCVREYLDMREIFETDENFRNRCSPNSIMPARADRPTRITRGQGFVN